MVACQQAETAGKDRQALGQAELRRKIGDEWRLDGRLRVGAGKPRGAVIAQVRLEVLADALEMSQETRVLAGGVEQGLVDAAEQQHWIVAGRFPQITIQPAEQLDRRMVPATPQIVGELAQRGERGRQ